MTIQELGSIGEFIAAVATVATLAYLAIQVRQNTRALRSSTFEQISMDMSLAADSIAKSPDLAAILAKVGLGERTPEERLRFHFFLLMTFRRLEAVHVQSLFGSIDAERTRGLRMVAGGEERLRRGVRGTRRRRAGVRRSRSDTPRLRTRVAPLTSHQELQR